MSAVLASARRTLQIEADAVYAAKSRLGREFEEAAQCILAAHGRVVVTGMGKSGLIGRKIAATLASTGTPAFFMHPAEASHGDLGMVTSQDVVLALSSSGETQEILSLLPMLKRFDIPLIALVGRSGSTLGEQADIYLDSRIEAEACPLNLAPTASTTVALALGDALALALLEQRGFTPQDFAQFHPGGSLGKRLFLRVCDIMHTGQGIPVTSVAAGMHEALLEMTAKGLGMTAVLDSSQRLVGIITDGDLRRALDRNLDFYTTAPEELMTPDPYTIRPEELAARGLQLMQENAINGLLVLDEDHQLVGAFNTHDLLRAGVA